MFFLLNGAAAEHLRRRQPWLGIRDSSALETHTGVLRAFETHTWVLCAWDPLREEEGEGYAA